MSDDHDDDPVGYKKPPRRSRFKSGQSGNPRGRPKGSKNLSTLIKTELDEVIPVNEGGKTRRITKREALVKTQVAKALKGDHKAAQLLMTLDVTIEGQDREAQALEQVAAEDQAILQAYEESLRPQDPPQAPSEPHQDEKPEGDTNDTDNS